MANKPVGAPRSVQHTPITRAEIVNAQEHTKSNAEAARYLGVGYLRYRKYAKIYNIFDSHTNQTGIGTNKGYAAKASTIKLKDIFANKHLGYNMVRLKNRMIARNLLIEECDICKFNERRITDSKSPLLLTFKDGKKDFTQGNLQLLCYNCLFLTTGAPSVANRGYIVKSFNSPQDIPKVWQVDHRPADVLDVGETDSDNTEDPFADLKAEAMKELGRD